MASATPFGQKLKRRVKLGSEALSFSPPRPVDGIDLHDYFEEVAQVYAPWSNPFAYYMRLVDELAALRELVIVPLCELMSAERSRARVIGLRHDVDSDPVTALRCARYLARKGIGGSFYLLHTAPYYGAFAGTCFLRRPELREWVKGLIVAGCELGLHNDALGVYNTHGLSGAKALQQELCWLKGQGAVVRGTVAHKSGCAYGAENYEIFAGRQLWRRTLRNEQGRWIPLGIMHEASFGLTYEGTFARPKPVVDRAEAARFFSDRASADIRSQAWMRRYLLDNPCCQWDVDVQAWLVGRDSWVTAGRVDGQVLFEWDLGLNQMVDVVRALPIGTRAVIVLHPEYVRADH